MKFSRQKPPPKAPSSRSGISGNGGACRRSTPALSAMTQLGSLYALPAGLIFRRLATTVHSTGLHHHYPPTLFLHPPSSHQLQLAVWALPFVARRYVIEEIGSLNGHSKLRIILHSCNAAQAGPFKSTPLASDHAARIFSPSSARMLRAFMPRQFQAACLPPISRVEQVQDVELGSPAIRKLPKPEENHSVNEL